MTRNSISQRNKNICSYAKSLQSCLTLCDPKDGSPPGSPVPGILQARTRVGFHFLQLMKVKSESEVFQSGPTLRDPVDCSPPGSSLHGSFQARVLKWGAIGFSNNSKTISPLNIVFIYLFACVRSQLWHMGSLFHPSGRIFSCSAQTLQLWCSSSVVVVLELSFSMACGILVP